MLVAAVIVWLRDPRSAGRRGYALVWLGLVILASIVFVLPFILNFTAEAHGVALVHTRRPFTKWLGDMALIYGILAVAADRRRSRAG